MMVLRQQQLIDFFKVPLLGSHKVSQPTLLIVITHAQETCQGQLFIQGEGTLKVYQIQMH